jgi:hypothetical protein
VEGSRSASGRSQIRSSTNDLSMIIVSDDSLKVSFIPLLAGCCLVTRAIYLGKITCLSGSNYENATLCRTIAIVSEAFLLRLTESSTTRILGSLQFLLFRC